MANVTISGDDHKEVLKALLECLKDNGILIDFEPLVSNYHSTFLLKVMKDDDKKRPNVYI